MSADPQAQNPTPPPYVKPVTCLSSEDHHISDHLLHYLGCLRYDKRDDLFKESNEIWEQEIKHYEETDPSSEPSPRALAKKKRETWEKNCEKELRRVGILREAIRTDVHDSHLDRKIRESSQKWRDSRNLQQCQPTNDATKPAEYNLERDISIPIIQYKLRGEENGAASKERVWGDFPDQKTKLDLLGEGTEVNLLSKDRHPDRIKYFHFPSNNMIWAENALSRYFGEARPDRHAIRRELKKMPFLHWETSRQREKSARTITQTVERNKRKKAEYLDDLKKKRVDARKALGSGPATPQNSTSPKRSGTRIDSFGDTIDPKFFPDAMLFEENGRLKVKNPLGQYMLDAARLFEGMSNYRDKKLLEKYLGGDTPLHPRRTLDQAYHWKLNTTKKRDRDQVVYRATTIPSDGYHTYDRKEENWPHHIDFKIEGDCAECRSRIRKVSRVIMVDQLWMWVLDKKTIITCFPKRYGVNKHDSSGVHKSIRRRLEAKPQIRTVFDLGLIILDECSNVFFDRTSIDPSQPPVIDIFSKAIGNVMHKQTAAFDRLWKWTEVASKAYRSKSAISSSQLEVPLLDINPEGKLQREIKDIIEELDIMLHITKCHRTILKQYVDNAENMLDPYGDYGRAHTKMETSLSLYNKSLRYQKQVAKDIEVQEGYISKMKNQLTEEALQEKKNGLEELKEKGNERQDYTWFMLKADELRELVEGRIAELCELRASAVSTADSVKDLLELKQQQAGVVQAWQAVNQASETIKQGRSIMMFTLVTILPLSFMSSIFGMNNLEFSGEGWAIRDELRLMFPVSAAVIVVSLFWAYSDWSRVALWAVYKRVTTWFVVKTRLFDIWLDISKPKKDMIEKANRASEHLFNEAREARYKRNLQARNKEETNGTGETDETSGGTPLSSAASNTMLMQERREYQNGKPHDVEMGNISSHQY
ncbi:hypothetical protein PG997_002120 [Apiospora hydei]|uniref:Uncharacterized protein n=1 Tax=Apiospora hydei TaxID=1337664 RepID=A0ABR1X8K7_9PEZI